MSLITRCPVCTTMFRVVPDQLKVAQGWVRCGQCGEVFEASLQLVPGQAPALGALASPPDANREHDPSVTGPQAPLQPISPAAPPEPPEPPKPPIDASTGPPSLAPGPVDAEPMQPPSSPAVAGMLAKAPLTVDDPAVQAGPVQSGPADVLPIKAQPEPLGRQEPTFATEAYGVHPPNPADAKAVNFQAAEPEPASSAAQAPEANPEVSFVSEARRKDFWKTPRVRALLGGLGLALLLALSLQWMVQQKDVLAAQAPRLAPLLQALCRPLGCSIRPLRRIESLVIDSSSFSKTGPDAYRLTFVFKNTGAAALEIPALEVTLTDRQDQALVRRVVTPAQFGATAVTLGAYSELAGAVSLKVSSDQAQGAASSLPAAPLPVAGYRILAFYP